MSYRSRDICLSRYEKPLLTPDSYLDVYNKCSPFPFPSPSPSALFRLVIAFLMRRFNISLSQEQLRVFRALFEFRDAIARQEDEVRSIAWIFRF